MKKYVILFSALLLCTTTSMHGGWWGNWSWGSEYTTNAKVLEVYNAIIHMAGRNHSQETLDKLFNLAYQIHSQIEENARTHEVSYDAIKNDSIINCFLEHIKVSIEVEARIIHFSEYDAKNIAQTFLREQTQKISGLCPYKSEITSPYDLPAGVFASIIGDSLRTKIQQISTRYRPASSQISWAELLITAGIIILDAATKEEAASPPYYPTSSQTSEPVPTPTPRPRTTTPGQAYEEGGLQKVRPDECSLMCYEDFGQDRERIFCNFCGKPACKPCWQGNINYNRYCGQGCFDSTAYSAQERSFWKNRIKTVLKDSTTYCVLCNKYVEGMQTLRNCAHKMCTMCQAMWGSLEGACSEYCPRCTKPLA